MDYGTGQTDVNVRKVGKSGQNSYKRKNMHPVLWIWMNTFYGIKDFRRERGVRWEGGVSWYCSSSVGIWVWVFV